MSSFNVEVAALGPVFGYPRLEVFEGEQFADQGPDLAYDQRKRVSLTVSGDATFGEVVDKAAKQFGVSIAPPETPISRRVPTIALANTDDEGYSNLEFIHTVETDGSPGWPVHWQDITVAELVASADAGLLGNVDPRRSVFWPVIPQGVFTDVGGALLWLWWAWGQALTVRDSIEFVRISLKRMTKAREVAQSEENWHPILRRINDLMAYLDSAPRTTADIQEKTGFAAPTVDGMMEGLGYALADDGHWHIGGDRAAVIIRAALMEFKREGNVLDEEIPRRLDELLADDEDS
jgi:hypothetical protein